MVEAEPANFRTAKLLELVDELTNLTNTVIHLELASMSDQSFIREIADQVGARCVYYRQNLGIPMLEVSKSLIFRRF